MCKKKIHAPIGVKLDEEGAILAEHRVGEGVLVEMHDRLEAGRVQRWIAAQRDIVERGHRSGRCMYKRKKRQ